MDLAANHVVKSTLAGCLSGTCSTILFQPLDLVKTRLQQNVGLQNAPGMFGVVRNVLATEKRVSALWTGIVPSITRTVPGVGLYFGSLECLKKNFTTRSTDRRRRVANNLCLGMAARSISGCIMIPVTVVKTRFESRVYNYNRMSQALTAIYRTEGVRGLSCGLLPTLIRDAPYSGLYYMIYTQLKEWMTMTTVTTSGIAAATSTGGDANNNSNNNIGSFLCKVAAGMVASAVTHPSDVVKTQMQLYPKEYAKVYITCSSIYAESGIGGFMVGIAPRMLRRTLMTALAWTVYESVMAQAGLK